MLCVTMLNLVTLTSGVQWRQRVSDIGGTAFPFPSPCFPPFPSPPHLTPSPSIPTSPLKSRTP